MTTINSTVLPFVYAEGDNNLKESFDKIEREVDLQYALEQEQAAHQSTRQQLQRHIEESTRISKEQQIETLLNDHHVLPAARKTVAKLLALGDAGEMELGQNGRLRAKYDAREVSEMVSDWFGQNQHFIGDGSAESAPAASRLDRAKMSTKSKSNYISEHGMEAYLKLPLTNDVKKKK